MNRFLYDTHIHTKEGSACGKARAREQVRSYKELGYSGIIITDHFFNGNSAVSRRLPWNQRVEAFCVGFENARNEGEKIGLDVFFGWEANYKGTEFLIYGLDKEWLLHHPEMLKWSVEEQYEVVKRDGGMVVHAHPFRRAIYIRQTRLYPEHVDAVEAFNWGNEKRDPQFNKEAFQYAKQHRLPMTEGSDSHSVKDPHGGMVFEEKCKDVFDFIDKVKRNEGYTLMSRNG